MFFILSFYAFFTISESQPVKPDLNIVINLNEGSNPYEAEQKSEQQPSLFAEHDVGPSINTQGDCLKSVLHTNKYSFGQRQLRVVC